MGGPIRQLSRRGGVCIVEANDIGAAGGVAEVDALDERAVADHAGALAADAGGIDIALNAVSFPFVHHTPLAELTVDDVMHPIDAYLTTNLITAMAVARHMTARRSGTILTLSAGASRVLPPGSLGYGTTCGAIETMTSASRSSSDRVAFVSTAASAPARRRTLQRLLHR